MSKTAVEYTREWRLRFPERKREVARLANRRRRDILDKIKMERGCVDCGFDSAGEALHFDHRDPRTKSFGIGTSATTAWSRVLEEIEKCDIRCANCHAIRSKRLDHHLGR